MVELDLYTVLAFKVLRDNNLQCILVNKNVDFTYFFSKNGEDFSLMRAETRPKSEILIAP